MGSATRAPNIIAVSGSPMGSTECLASGIDRSHSSASSRASSGLSARAVALALNWLCVGRRWKLPRRRARRERGAQRGAPKQRSAALLAAARSGVVIALPADHQLPRDARGFVGQRHGGELGRLSVDQLNQPARVLPLAEPHLFDHGGGAGDENAAQSLIAGARDHAEPRLAGGG